MRTLNLKGLLSLSFVFVASVAVAAPSLCGDGGAYEHVIITSRDLKHSGSELSFERLVRHRDSLGMRSTVVAVEDIYECYPGRVAAEQIRNFIRDAKARWRTSYILLGGDTDIVPAMMLYARNKSVPSDMYYGCLDGDFNSDGDELWGEAGDGLDFEYDIFVGRASVESEEEMENFVYKTITYENSPINASYHTKMLHWNGIEKGVGNTSRWVDEYAKLDSDLTVQLCRAESGSKSAVETAQRFGAANVGYYLGAAHGTVMRTSALTNKFADNMRNRDRYFFFASIACLTGQYTKDCLAEHLTTSTRQGGAFAGFFNSVTAYAPYIINYLTAMRNSYFKGHVTRLGELRAAVARCYPAARYMSDMGARYQAYHFTLFGDPATQWRMVDSRPVDYIFDFETLGDLSGNNHSTQLCGDARIVKSRLSLDGDGDYAVVPHSKWNPMGGSVEMALSVDVKPRRSAAAMPILSKGATSSPFRLSIDADNHAVLELNVDSPQYGSSYRKFRSASAMADGRWQRVEVSLDYPNNRLLIYIDGRFDAIYNLLQSPIYLGVVDEPLYIGSDGADGFFRGDIDNVKVVGNKKQL